MEFFEEVCGPPDVRGRPAAQPPHPAYPLSARLVRHASLRVLIWRLKAKGIFNDEEVERLFSELDREMPGVPPVQDLPRECARARERKDQSSHRHGFR